MNYAEMLTSIIEQSELSLRQISRRCAEFDLSITPSYISQLKNGKLPPPTPEVSMILAKACGSKEESKLIFQGYLEKAPDVIKEYRLASSELHKVMLESLYKSQNDGQMADYAKNYLASLDILSTIEMSSKCVKDGEINIEKDFVKDMTLAAGGLVQGKEDILSMFLSDSAMQPAIPVHSLIYILPTKPELLKSRDIIAFYPPGKKQVAIRRLFFSHDRILLVPDDQMSEIFIIDSFDEIDYLGKIVSFKVDL